ncbi:MAG: 50S ribosomal protein L3 N(5)-glutamine methyltransferase [Saccharospirillum sp.]|nr:50S ribosomal protein L3 N(5)-glutamine methyltransferase [Saccharospirillum sp.]
MPRVFSSLDFADPATQSECLTELTSLGDWVRLVATTMGEHSVFFGHGFESAWDESVFLCLRALSLEWDAPAVVFSSRLRVAERQKLWSLLQQRCVERVPTAYLLEESWFLGEPYRVTPDVLIPRSPIAELIENGFEPWLTRPPQRVLDLCTGSGCIGIATALAFPEAEVHLSDLSDAAVRIAIDNVDTKDLGYQVSVYQGDLFAGLPEEPYDLILCNPPYVDAEDIETMPPEFEHEPKMALAAGDDGLDVVRRLLVEAPRYLSDDGWLVCEVGNSAAALIDAFPDLPFEWPEFATGGHGVFILPARALRSK